MSFVFFLNLVFGGGVRVIVLRGSWVVLKYLLLIVVVIIATLVVVWIVGGIRSRL